MLYKFHQTESQMITSLQHNESANVIKKYTYRITYSVPPWAKGRITADCIREINIEEEILYNLCLIVLNNRTQLICEN